MVDEQADGIPVEAVPDATDDPDGWDQADEDAEVDIAVTTMASMQRAVAAD